jgi:hypothetical protein
MTATKRRPASEAQADVPNLLIKAEGEIDGLELTGLVIDPDELAGTTGTVTPIEPETAEFVPVAPVRRFRVMRRFPLSGTVMAEVGTILEEAPEWPFRRAKQFVDLGYLAPIVTEEG